MIRAITNYMFNTRLGTVFASRPSCSVAPSPEEELKAGMTLSGWRTIFLQRFRHTLKLPFSAAPSTNFLARSRA